MKVKLDDYEVRVLIVGVQYILDSRRKKDER